MGLSLPGHNMLGFYYGRSNPRRGDTRSAGESKTIGRKPAWISRAGYAEAEGLGR